MNNMNSIKYSITTKPNEDIIIQIPLDNLDPLKNHTFKVYEDGKLDQMVQSIKEMGIIHHGVARPIKGTDKYEIISGHNRAYAARLAGLSEMSFIIRDLSDDEAIILSNEANIAQRTFENWLPSEKANSIFQYYEAIKRQGARTDLSQDTSGENHQKSVEDSARNKTARTYGVTEHIIRLYLELFRLIDPLKERLDNNEFGTTSAQSLSYISISGQTLVNSVLGEDRYKLTTKKSKEVRQILEDVKVDNLSNEEKETVKKNIRGILTGASNISEFEIPAYEFETIKIKKTQYDRLFSNMTSTEVIDEIIKAVEFFRKNVVTPLRKSSRKPDATGHVIPEENNAGVIND